MAGGKNTQFNQGIGIFSSQESNDSSSDVEGDDSSTIVDCDDDCEDLKTAKKDKNLPNHNDSWNGQLSHNPYNSKVPGGQNGKDDQNRSDTYNWLNNQRERSSTEYFGSDEEGSDRPYNGYRFVIIIRPLYWLPNRSVFFTYSQQPFKNFPKNTNGFPKFTHRGGSWLMSTNIWKKKKINFDNNTEN